MRAPPGGVDAQGRGAVLILPLSHARTLRRLPAPMAHFGDEFGDERCFGNPMSDAERDEVPAEDVNALLSRALAHVLVRYTRATVLREC